MGASASVEASENPANEIPVVAIPTPDDKINDAEYWRNILLHFEGYLSPWGSDVTRADAPPASIFPVFMNTNQNLYIQETGADGNCGIYSVQTWLLFKYFLSSTNFLSIKNFARKASGDYHFTQDFVQERGASNLRDPTSIFYKLRDIGDIMPSQTIREELQQLLPRHKQLYGNEKTFRKYNWLSKNEWLDDAALKILGWIAHQGARGRKPINITTFTTGTNVLTYDRAKSLQSTHRSTDWLNLPDNILSLIHI